MFEAGAAVGEETGKCLDPGGEGAHWRFVLLPKLLFAPNSIFAAKTTICTKNYFLHQRHTFAQIALSLEACACTWITVHQKI